MDEHSNSPRRIITVTAIAMASIALSCLASLMYSFMGGDSKNSDVASLFVLQQFAIVLAALVVLACYAYFRRAHPGRALAAIWQHLPGWLVFAILVLGSLTLMGELSFLLLVGELSTSHWDTHVSLICLLSTSLAFGLLFATAHAQAGREPYSKERW